MRFISLTHFYYYDFFAFFRVNFSIFIFVELEISGNEYLFLCGWWTYVRRQNVITRNVFMTLLLKMMKLNFCVRTVCMCFDWIHLTRNGNRENFYTLIWNLFVFTLAMNHISWDTFTSSLPLTSIEWKTLNHFPFFYRNILQNSDAFNCLWTIATDDKRVERKIKRWHDLVKLKIRK